MFKTLLFSAALAVSTGVAQAATIDASGAVTPVSLNQWPTGYNAGFSLSFADILGAGDSLSSWSLTVGTTDPGSYFSTLWVNGSGDPSVCSYGSPLSISGYNSTSGSFTSSCNATDAKRFDFFLQVQNGTYGPGDLTFSLSSDDLSSAVMAMPLPAGAWLLVSALAALGGLSRRRGRPGAEA